MSAISKFRPVPGVCGQSNWLSSGWGSCRYAASILQPDLGHSHSPIIWKSVYSLRADLDQKKENQIFAESFNIAQEGLAKRFRLAPWHLLYSPSRFQRACSNVHEFVENYIREWNLESGKDEDTESYGFIDQVSKEPEGIHDLRDQLLNVLLAGRDTTACCLSWTL